MVGGAPEILSRLTIEFEQTDKYIYHVEYNNATQACTTHRPEIGSSTEFQTPSLGVDTMPRRGPDWVHGIRKERDLWG